MPEPGTQQRGQGKGPPMWASGVLGTDSKKSGRYLGRWPGSGNGEVRGLG